MAAGATRALAFGVLLTYQIVPRRKMTVTVSNRQSACEICHRGYTGVGSAPKGGDKVQGSGTSATIHFPIWVQLKAVWGYGCVSRRIYLNSAGQRERNGI